MHTNHISKFKKNPVDNRLVNSFFEERKTRLEQLKLLGRYDKRNIMLVLFYISFFIFFPIFFLYPILYRINPKKFSDGAYFNNIQAPILIVLALTVILIAKIIYRRTTPQLNKEEAIIEQKKNDLFHPFERTALICLDITKVFDRYAKSPIKADFIGPDIESLDRSGRRDLIGYDRYYKKVVPINSFFAGLSDERDIENRLKDLKLYEKLGINKENVIKVLTKINNFLKPGQQTFAGDFNLGALLFNKIAEAFILAYNDKINKFLKALTEVSILIDEYLKTTKSIQLYGSSLVIYNIYLLIKVRIKAICLFPITLICMILLGIILPKKIMIWIPMLRSYGIEEGVLGTIFIGTVGLYLTLLRFNTGTSVKSGVGTVQKAPAQK